MPKGKNGNQNKVEKLQHQMIQVNRKIGNADGGRHEWLKSHNMKQYVVTLTDVAVLPQIKVGGLSDTFTGKIILSPNTLTYSVLGGDTSHIPQSAIWNEYAKLYDFWMAEEIKLEYFPSITRVETTLSGIQDTAILPTSSGHLPDTEPATTAFFNPAISLAVGQTQSSNLLARKTGNLHMP